MALYNMASDTATRQIVWVSTNAVKGRPQLNSHRPDRLGATMAAEGIDGFSAADLAGLHHSYVGKG